MDDSDGLDLDEPIRQRERGPAATTTCENPGLCKSPSGRGCSSALTSHSPAVLLMSRKRTARRLHALDRNTMPLRSARQRVPSTDATQFGAAGCAYCAAS